MIKDLLERYKSITIHERNIQVLLTDTLKKVAFQQK